MKGRGRRSWTLGLLSMLTLAVPAVAQQVYVYPEKGQTSDLQAKDTAECRTWATQQSGVNPSAPPPASGVGSHAAGTVGGAARGAAVGAAVGAIAGDAGKGAAAGAVVGGVGGRRGSKAAKAQQQAATTDSFNRAFGACMSGRGYSVK